MSSFSHHALLYLRTLYIVWSLVRRRVTRRLTGLQTMHNVLKIAKHFETVAVRLRLIFQFTYVQYCTLFGYNGQDISFKSTHLILIFWYLQLRLPLRLSLHEVVLLVRGLPWRLNLLLWISPLSTFPDTDKSVIMKTSLTLKNRYLVLLGPGSWPTAGRRMVCLLSQNCLFL